MRRLTARAKLQSTPDNGEDARAHDDWRPSVVREPRSRQRGLNERAGIGICVTCRRGETHAAPPRLWRLRMNAHQDHPSLARGSFNDGRRAVRILCHNRPPACELRTIFPVMLDRGGVDSGDGDCGFTVPVCGC